MQSFELTNSGAAADIVTGVNAIDINPAHQLIACGTETEGGRGTVELWDHRARERAGVLKLPYSKLVSYSSAKAPDPTDDILGISRTGLSVTALASRSNGLHLGVGTSTGHTLLYDLRTTTPFTTKDQGYGLPIKKIEWAERTGLDEGYVCTADEKVLKIWDRETVRCLLPEIVA
jgi:ribosome biogenesis protein ENP2